LQEINPGVGFEVRRRKLRTGNELVFARNFKIGFIYGANIATVISQLSRAQLIVFTMPYTFEKPTSEGVV